MAEDSTAEYLDSRAAAQQRQNSLQADAGSDYDRSENALSEPSYPISLLNSTGLRAPANRPVQTALISEVQQAYGNRAVQRMFSGEGHGMAPGSGNLAVQRWQLSRQDRLPHGSGVAGIEVPSSEVQSEIKSDSVAQEQRGQEQAGASRAGGSPSAGAGLVIVSRRATSIPAPLVVVQRRGYKDLDINKFLEENPQNEDEERGEYLTRVTALFKRLFQYQDRGDLRYLRNKAWGATKHMKAYPSAMPRKLADNFNEHILGNMAGVGWHSESTHTNGQAGYSYANRQDLASSKGTYFASQVKIADTNKTGNNGRSTFFPPGMGIDEIRADALYVANTYPAVGQIRRGRGPSSGIMIDCLMNGERIDSAYPYKPGW